LDGGVGKALRIKVAAFGQAQNDLRELEAGGFYCFGASRAQALSKACPKAFTSSGP
jgi:hypothetical protein